MNRKWEIMELLSDEELEYQYNDLLKRYLDGSYKHRNGEIYTVIDVTTININGTSYWGFVYSKNPFKGPYHTRPIYEFLDGRFTTIKRNKGEIYGTQNSNA